MSRIYIAEMLHDSNASYKSNYRMIMIEEVMQMASSTTTECLYYLEKERKPLYNK